MTVYDEPPREEYRPEQRDAPPQSYDARHMYDTPYEEERRERTEITEVVTVEHRSTVESSLPAEEDDSQFVPGMREEADQGVPVLRDPDYRLPPGYKEKPEERKPINSIKYDVISICSRA